jgi:hypothetical protein
VGSRSSRRAIACLATVAALCAVTACEVPVTGAPNCTVTPNDSYWHAKVTALPVSPSSATFIATEGSNSPLHADFGSGLWDGGPIGIPFVVVPGTQAKVKVTFSIAGESDPGPYPIPANAPVEGGSASTGDRHVIVVDRDRCQLYEMWNAKLQKDGVTWKAGSGATWSLSSDAMRPAGWTSADAAGLPILPGLVRYEEVAAGHVDHAIRITVPTTRTSYIWPARHQAGSTSSTSAPPMGTWLRMKSSINPSSYPASVRPIIIALQTFGAIVADNGSAWYISGAPDSRWNNDDLHALGAITGNAFQVVDASSLMVSPNSEQAK